MVSRENAHEVGQYTAMAIEDEENGFVLVQMPGLEPSRVRTRARMEAYETVAPSHIGLPRNKFERWADENRDRLSGGLRLGELYWINPSNLSLRELHEWGLNDVLWPARACDPTVASTGLVASLRKVTLQTRMNHVVVFKLLGIDEFFHIEFNDATPFIPLYDRRRSALESDLRKCNNHAIYLNAIDAAKREPDLLPNPPKRNLNVIDVDTFSDVIAPPRKRVKKDEIPDEEDLELPSNLDDDNDFLPPDDDDDDDDFNAVSPDNSTTTETDTKKPSTTTTTTTTSRLLSAPRQPVPPPPQVTLSQQVLTLLDDCGLTPYHDTFVQWGAESMAELYELTDADCSTMGMPLLKRRRLLRAIHDHRYPNASN